MIYNQKKHFVENPILKICCSVVLYIYLLHAKQFINYLTIRAIIKSEKLEELFYFVSQRFQTNYKQVAKYMFEI